MYVLSKILWIPDFHGISLYIQCIIFHAIGTQNRRLSGGNMLYFILFYLNEIVYIYIYILNFTCCTAWRCKNRNKGTVSELGIICIFQLLWWASTRVHPAKRSHLSFYFSPLCLLYYGELIFWMGRNQAELPVFSGLQPWEKLLWQTHNSYSQFILHIGYIFLTIIVRRCLI